MSDDRETTMDGSGSWWKRVLAWIGIPASLFLILLILLLVIPPSKIEAERERLRSEGLPGSLVELDAWAEAPAGVTNGAPEVARLGEQLAALEYRPENPDLWNSLRERLNSHGLDAGDWDSAEVKQELRTNAGLREEFRRFMKTAEPILDELDRALEADAFAYDVDYTGGAGMPLPHLPWIREAARFTARDACLEALDGDADAALQSVRKGLDLAATLEREPLLVSQLVRIASEVVVVEGLQDVLAVSRPGPDALRKTADRLGAVRSLGEPVIYWGHLGEYLMWLDLERELRGGTGPGVPVSLRWSPVVRLMTANGIGCYRMVLKAAKATPAEFRAEYRGIDLEKEVSRWNVLARLMLPALDRAVVRGFERQERLRLAELGLRLYADRLEGTPYPETAAGADSPLAEDIFTEQPLRLHRTDDGWLVLHSVGFDQADAWPEISKRFHGGVYRPDPDGRPGGEIPGDDLFFAVPIPDAGPADADVQEESH